MYCELFSELLRWRPESSKLIVDAGTQELANAPSWVPNWTKVEKVLQYDEQYFYNTDGPNATPGSTPEVTVNDCELTVKGVCYGDIIFHSTRFPPFEWLRIRFSTEDPKAGAFDLDDAELVSTIIEVTRDLALCLNATKSHIGASGGNQVVTRAFHIAVLGTEHHFDYCEKWYEVLSAGCSDISGDINSKTGSLDII